MDNPDGTPERYPPALIDAIRELGAAVMSGDTGKCVELQAVLNAELRARGELAFDFPEAYYQLSHESMHAALTGDPQRAQELADQAEAIRRKLIEEAGMSYDELQADAVASAEQFEYPPEYLSLQEQAGAAFERGDFDECRRLVAEANTLMEERTGIVNIVNVINWIQ